MGTTDRVISTVEDYVKFVSDSIQSLGERPELKIKADDTYYPHIVKWNKASQPLLLLLLTIFKKSFSPRSKVGRKGTWMKMILKDINRLHGNNGYCISGKKFLDINKCDNVYDFLDHISGIGVIPGVAIRVCLIRSICKNAEAVKEDMEIAALNKYSLMYPFADKDHAVVYKAHERQFFGLFSTLDPLSVDQFSFKQVAVKNIIHDIDSHEEASWSNLVEMINHWLVRIDESIKMAIINDVMINSNERNTPGTIQQIRKGGVSIYRRESRKLIDMLYVFRLAESTNNIFMNAHYLKFGNQFFINMTKDDLKRVADLMRLKYAINVSFSKIKTMVFYRMLAVLRKSSSQINDIKVIDAKEFDETYRFTDDDDDTNDNEDDDSDDNEDDDTEDNDDDDDDDDVVIVDNSNGNYDYADDIEVSIVAVSPITFSLKSPAEKVISSSSLSSSSSEGREVCNCKKSRCLKL